MQRKGKHSVELLDTFPSPFLIRVDDHFGVRARAEGVTSLHQLVVKLDVVVNLAVETYRHRAVFVVDRLRSSLEIDDREPPHSHVKTMRLILVAPPAVRSAMSEAVSHAREQAFLNKAREPKYSAHPKAMRLRSESAPVKQIDAA